jgi:hypothetical protein
MKKTLAALTVIGLAAAALSAPAQAVKLLVCGGPDAVANMQSQTIAEAKAKDRWERTCRPLQ